MEKKIFKYNLSFYYQSLIVYFVALVIFIVLKGRFSGDEFSLLFKDPIIYFFGLIIIITLASLIYSLFENKRIEFGENEFKLISSTRKKVITKDQIESIKFTRNRRFIKTFNLILIKLRNRKRRLILRPYEFDNSAELINNFSRLKEDLK